MDLIGGIDLHNIERYKSNRLPKGRKVRFLNKNGHDYQREDANKYFSKDDILTVKEIYVGGWSSEVEFEEVPNKKFNTVMFEDII